MAGDQIMGGWRMGSLEQPLRKRLDLRIGILPSEADRSFLVGWVDALMHLQLQQLPLHPASNLTVVRELG